MLKGFLSGLAVSALTLAALAVAVPMTPDPAAGSPAPAPVLSPDASASPAPTGPGLEELALPDPRAALHVAAPPPSILPPTEPDEPAFAPETAALPRELIDFGRRAPLAPARNAPLVPGLGSARSADAPPPSPLPRNAEAPATALNLQIGPRPTIVLASFLAPQPPVWTAGPALELSPPSPRMMTPERPTLLTVRELRSDRLPQIGAPPPSAPEGAREPARLRHAMAVSRPSEGRPMLGVIIAYAGVVPDLPVTLAVDPLGADVTDRSRAWREMGREVAILATGLPTGADARDIEVTLQSHLRSLPDTVALVDLPDGGVARDRVLAAQAVAILAEDGYGLVTHATGLNAAARMAESAGVAALTTVERLVATDNAAAMRRALDRAALRATQDGSSLIFIEGSAEALETLRDWMDTSRGRDLDLVPLSALLNR